MSWRGVTLVESMAALAVAGLGIVGVALMTQKGAEQNRRTFAQTQAELVVQAELERLTLIGCKPTCATVQGWDQRVYDVWWSANGTLTTVAPAPGSNQRRYHVSIDVDPPFEGAETGDPPLARAIANGLPGDQINLRVTVSWNDTPGAPMRVLAMQTRMAP